MKYNYRTMKNLFLRQSYIDSWEDYSRSLRKSSSITWDYVVLTASNEEQAAGYRQQIEYRRKRKLLPERTKYVVLSDPDGKRVGSGGATFYVLRYIAEQEGTEEPFKNRRILVIHSGGDSKRVPQYSACGKLFAPVMRELPNGQSSTLFDEFIIGMSGMPARMQEGMLVLSGDVLLLFNPLQIDFQVHGAAAISMKESVETGKDHGVFLSDENGCVDLFLHKKSVARLAELGAVDERGNVDLDTGAILMDGQMLNALYSLISTDGVIDEGKFEEFVNDRARVSFYGDFLYPLAKHTTLKEFKKEAAEGTICQELLDCREKLWEVLHGFVLKLLRVSPAEFIHFGTTGELSELVTEGIDNYFFLDWKRYVMTNGEYSGKNAAHTSYVLPGTRIGNGSYIENSVIEENVRIGKNSVVSGVDLKDVVIPDDVVLHGLKLQDGRYTVRVYGVNDNPKGKLGEKAAFLSADLDTFMQAFELSEEELWPGETGKSGDRSLWNAQLYPVCANMEEAVKAALMVYKIVVASTDGKEKKQHDDVWVSLQKWLASERTSLFESFNAADVQALTKRKQKLEDRILTARFLEAVKERRKVADALELFGEEGIDERKYRLLMKAAEESPLADRIRIYYYLSRHMKTDRKSLDGQSYDVLESQSFQTLGKAIFQSAVQHIQGREDYRIARESVSVRLPVRVNWGGGWTDTPPYCIEEGGVVLNAAIKLNGKSPVCAEVQRLKEYVIRFESTDIGVKGQASSVEEIQDCYNPYDAFALHKAALIACGIIPREGSENLSKLLKRLGGGILISTRVEGVPKGSGLGTSSILSAACVKALFKFFGQMVSDDALCDIVLSMEQLMSTGGGWQDQIGGLTTGIKMITTKPGINQNIRIRKLIVPEEAMMELKERFALIYTGQRRLARNLLRDVVGGYISGRPETVEALREMKKTAVLMGFELEQGNIDGFAKLLSYHWELSKQLDAGSTNTCIDQIFMSCDDLLDARFIAGAGGGGFLQVILKKGVKKEALSKRLREVFGDSGVDVWDCAFV